MTLHRQPGTIEHLLFSKVIQVRPARVEEITGISLDVLIKAANPNHPHNLSAVHIPALDAALMADGRDPVFIPRLNKMLQRICEDFGITECAEAGADTSEQILEAMSKLGLTVDTWKAAKCPNSDGGSNVTSRECDQMLSAISEMRETIDQMEKSIEAARPKSHLHVAGENRSAS